ncbi:hypothetical protein [Streptomyces sp. NPDC057939]|uniref:hypothetical protein n=1 Tax=Streptomyces sp. NPDC057939 TaxID=3346284 RepID=UPI0036E9FBD7
MSMPVRPTSPPTPALTLLGAARLHGDVVAGHARRARGGEAGVVVGGNADFRGGPEGSGTYREAPGGRAAGDRSPGPAGRGAVAPLPGGGTAVAAAGASTALVARRRRA